MMCENENCQCIDCLLKRASNKYKKDELIGRIVVATSNWDKCSGIVKEQKYEVISNDGWGCVEVVSMKDENGDDVIIELGTGNYEFEEDLI